MTTKARRFAHKILAVHVALLAAVLALVWLASAEIYEATQQDAKLAAKSHQELLADQTCRGIETYYAGIINDLGWIQKRQDPDSTQPTTSGLTPAAARMLERGFRPLAARLIAEQLGDRVSALFSYDKQTGAVVPILPEGSTLTGNQLPPTMQGWLRGVTQSRVSRFMKLQGQGVSLVAAPMGPGDPRLLVAVVPGKQIDAKFLPLLNEQNSASATLVDAHGDVITSSNTALEGLILNSFDNSDARAMMLDYEQHPRTSTKIITDAITIQGVNLGPRMLTIAPVTVAGDQWALVIAYPLANIDATVNRLLQRAVIWAIFVAISITAIIVSTAIQMIRYRSRLERVRHEMLTRELSQARQIQLNWLPDKSAICPAIDVAAINHPASHISGDFYNWFDLADGRQVIVIGDVTGHGMAAAFLMATTQMLVRNTMSTLSDPGPAMEEVNRQLCTQMFRGQFVTMLIMVLDFERGHIDIASAGHQAPLISEGAAFRVLDAQAQLALGIEKNIRYPTQRFELPSRASILLYTDGVVDAQNTSGERYSTEQLLAALYGRFASAQQFIDTVVNAVNEFRGGHELDDDLTLVAIQLQGIGPSSGLEAASVERRSTLTLTAGT